MPTRPRGPILDYRPQRRTQELLKDIHAVLDVSRDAGVLPMTNRQITYRLMGTGEYGKDVDGRVVDHVGNARRAINSPFRIDWDDIYDGKGSFAWPDAIWGADDFLDWARDEGRRQRTYRQPDQDRFLVGWCEAQGLLPLLTPFAHERGLPMISSGGFDSTTVRRKVARLHSESDHPWTILHVGDHDDPGEDIFRAMKEDVEAWADHDGRPDGQQIEIIRVAITDEQIDRYSLPGDPDDPAKVQAEAMSPMVMRDVWRDAIVSRQDGELLAARLRREAEMQAEIDQRMRRAVA